MPNFTRERHNPIDVIKYLWPTANLKHITYEKNLRVGDFNVVRQCGHDGTLMFTIEMFGEGLINIVNRIASPKNNPPDVEKLKGVLYTIGDIKHVTVFGDLKLKCSETQSYAGQRERIRMPVKCEYIY